MLCSTSLRLRYSLLFFLKDAYYSSVHVYAFKIMIPIPYQLSLCFKIMTQTPHQGDLNCDNSSAHHLKNNNNENTFHSCRYNMYYDVFQKCEIKLSTEIFVV